MKLRGHGIVDAYYEMVLLESVALPTCHGGRVVVTPKIIVCDKAVYLGLLRFNWWKM